MHTHEHITERAINAVTQLNDALDFEDWEIVRNVIRDELGDITEYLTGSRVT